VGRARPECSVHGLPCVFNYLRLLPEEDSLEFPEEELLLLLFPEELLLTAGALLLLLFWEELLVTAGVLLLFVELLSTAGALLLLLPWDELLFTAGALLLLFSEELLLTAGALFLFSFPEELLPTVAGVLLLVAELLLTEAGVLLPEFLTDEAGLASGVFPEDADLMVGCVAVLTDELLVADSCPEIRLPALFPDGEALPLMVSLLVAGDARRVVSVLWTSVFRSAGLAVTTPDLSDAGLFLTEAASVLVRADALSEARLSVD
jgi:hypothetical protein